MSLPHSLPANRFALLRQYCLFIYQSSKKHLLAASLLLLAVAITEGASLMLLVPAISYFSGDAGLPEKSPFLLQLANFTPDFAVFLVLFFVVLIARAIATYNRDMVLSAMRLEATDKLRAQLFDSMLHARWDHMVHQAHDAATEQLTSGINRVGAATMFLLKGVTTSILALMYVVISIKLAPAALLLSIVIGAGVLFLLRNINAMAYSLGMELSNTNRQLYNNVMFFLNGLKSVKAFSREEQQYQLFISQQSELRENQQGYQRKISRNQLIFSMVTAAALCMLVYIGVVVAEVSTVTLVLLVIVFSRLMPMFSELQNNYQRLFHTLPAFADISKAIADNAAHRNLPCNSCVLTMPVHSISIQQGSYRYATREQGFDNINVQLPVNSLTLLQGPSGSGKTTIADIFAGLLPLQRGQLCLDQQPLTSSTLSQWRSKVTYLTQDAFLFSGSVRQNICWGMSLSDDELIQAIKLAAAEFIFDLPQGVDSLVGDKGLLLSGGQRQRVVLARALCRKPSLLILDEATNALDHDTESRFLDTLHALKHLTTILLISHRPDIAQFADHVIDVSALYQREAV